MITSANCENACTHRHSDMVRWTKMELFLRRVMPVPAPPRCPQCGWHKTVVPKSDALVRGHSWFESCPECNHAPLERAQATTVDLVMAKLRDIVGK